MSIDTLMEMHPVVLENKMLASLGKIDNSALSGLFGS